MWLFTLLQPYQNRLFTAQEVKDVKDASDYSFTVWNSSQSDKLDFGTVMCCPPCKTSCPLVYVSLTWRGARYSPRWMPLMSVHSCPTTGWRRRGRGKGAGSTWQCIIACISVFAKVLNRFDWTSHTVQWPKLLYKSFLKLEPVAWCQANVKISVKFQNTCQGRAGAGGVDVVDDITASYSNLVRYKFLRQKLEDCLGSCIPNYSLTFAARITKVSIFTLGSDTVVLRMGLLEGKPLNHNQGFCLSEFSSRTKYWYVRRDLFSWVWPIQRHQMSLESIHTCINNIRVLWFSDPPSVS